MVIGLLADGDHGRARRRAGDPQRVRRRPDRRVLMRIADFFLVIPTFVLAIILTSIIRDARRVGSTEIFGIRLTLFAIVIVIGITSWSSTARIIRSQTLSLQGAARSSTARGSSAAAAATSCAATSCRTSSTSIVANAVLVVRGRGPHRDDAVVRRPRRSVPAVVGQILDAARDVGAPGLGAWWYFVPPGACIVLVVLAFTLVGGALDDMLNPKSGPPVRPIPTTCARCRRASSRSVDERTSPDAATTFARRSSPTVAGRSAPPAALPKLAVPAAAAPRGRAT